MSEDEFWEVADNWYQRSHKLREVWQDKTLSSSKRVKAYTLWSRMYFRVMNCFEIAKRIRIDESKPPLFKDGKFDI